MYGFFLFASDVAFGRSAFLELQMALEGFNRHMGRNKKSFQLQIRSSWSKYCAFLFQSALCSYSAAKIKEETWKKKILFFQVPARLSSLL